MTPGLFFFVLSIGLFIYVLFLKLYLRLEKDTNGILTLENEGLMIEIVKIKHKIQKKKELLEIQDQLLNENNIKH